MRQVVRQVVRGGKPASRPESNTPLVIRVLLRLVVACGVLMTLLVILVALLCPNTGFERGQSDEGAARSQMSNFGQAIHNYRSIHNNLPATLEELTRASGENPYPYIESIPNDPWGQPYRYRVVDSKHYLILSNGEDGAAHTDDDLKHPDEHD